MTETFIKGILIPVTAIAYFIFAKVVHLRPELITNLFTQAGNAQSLTLQQRAIACDSTVERVLPTMTRKELNDFVADCEGSKK